MQTLTLDQLDLLHRSGGLKSIRLTAAGGAFIVSAALHAGDDACLSTLRSRNPRRFSSADAAIATLRRIGITALQIDSSEWKPAERKNERGNPGRAAALRATHQAAAALKHAA